MANPIRTVIADENQQFVTKLVNRLQQYAEIQVVGTASEGQGVLDICADALPDVVILALDLPVIDGVRATRAVLDVNAQTGVLIIGAAAADEYALQAIKMGAKGYLQKQDSLENIYQAICQVYEGDVYIPSELASLMLHEFDRLS